ncbi:hypothetical protein [Streptomyces sp. NPDC058268]|uniref:hypothetical protein n=1 Tax=Streptomyces sp. NPDC058268 TaxID=3346413 RepID=UPI0036E1C4CB
MTRTAIPAEAFEHGDPKRYRRGCHCKQCVDGVTAEVRRGRYLRATGRGCLTTPDRAAAHIERLRTAGMPDKEILADALICTNVLSRIVRKSGRIHRATETRILAVKPRDTELNGSGTRIPGLGTTRRLRALAADGWTATEIGRGCGKHKQFIVYLQNQDDALSVRRWVADYVTDLYTQLAGRKPEDDGIPPHIAARTRKKADSKGWPPSATWDDDTIDSPTAHPDWTGYCGTDRGYWTHLSRKLPMCDRCTAAHQDWFAERADLDAQERSRQRFAARAKASTREADLAHDARELMRVSGLDYGQAAERLQVTRQHLQQALIRRPEPAKEAA